MGLFSKPFVASIQTILRQGPQPRPKKLKDMEPLVVLVTFPKESSETHKLISEIKAREDCVLFEVRTINVKILGLELLAVVCFCTVSEENRDSLVTEISDFLPQSLSG